VQLYKLYGLINLAFIFQDTSTRRQRSDLLALRVTLSPITTWKPLKIR